MGREYLILNKVIAGASAFTWMAQKGFLLELAPGKRLSTAPGQPLSFMLGWIGFSVICLTNLYLVRKKTQLFRKVGSVGAWLDFHIFCGLLGPMLIIFHSNFQVRGLVSISFWSMMVSFASGIAGRYFYVQLLGRKAEAKAQLIDYEERFKKAQAAMRPPMTNETLKALKRQALVRAGITEKISTGNADVVTVLVSTMMGDMRMLSASLALPEGVPRSLVAPLRDYALVRRRFITEAYFRRIMGYWHTFHLPFAIFMYVVSVIHIISALVFRVNH